ncbi:MAG: hypothetical protein U9N34_03905 [Candidatus Cloacimonadota bacterium]|nr:hypothetical protein [Candidatus Cloacimonadota bacterium]
MDSYAMDICSYGFVMVNGNANIIIKNIFGEYELLETLEYGELVDCIVVDDILYVADLDFGLRIIDITHEFFIAEIGDYFSGDGANKLLYQDNKIYLMNQGGLQIINVSNPAYPSIESQIYFEGMKDFDILGDFLYCIDDMILKIYNLQENNIEISETLITETATSVSISNTVLIISNSNQEIVAYNIVDKSSPQYLHSWYLNDEIRDIELIQNYVFVANSFDGFLIQRIEENLE